jgi:SET domain-containing protein
MPFLKKMEVRDLSSKYGHKQKGVVALEPIRAGEHVFNCDLSVCNYYKLEDPRNKLSKSEVRALIEANPEAVDYIRYYTYMLDDDLFDVPRNYKTQEITEECLLFNHSCDSNLGFDDEAEEFVVATRDIAEGEELTYDYGLMDTENSFWSGLICKCGAKNCRGELKFDWWRDPKWQEKHEKYAGAHVRRKIKKLREEQGKNQTSS